MSKVQRSNKETRKQPLFSLKEKRAIKHHKKELRDAPPMPLLQRH